jgi:hypothetical protein
MRLGFAEEAIERLVSCVLPILPDELPMVPEELPIVPEEPAPVAP